MRTFISLNLDDRARRAVKKYKELLKKAISEEEQSKIKWETEDKYHITLFFLGDVKDAMKRLINEKIDEISNLNIGKIDFEFERISAFPNLKNPRLIYLDVLDKEKKSFALSEAVDDYMNFLGFEKDKKYVPHITLGRVRRDKRLHLNDINIECENEKFTVNGVSLMKSTLTFKGSIYEELHRVEL